MKEKMLLDKKKFLDIIDNFDSVYEFEMKEFVGFVNIPVLRVKSASLDDHIKAQELSASSFMKSMLEKNKSDEKAFHPKTLFEIDIFHKCVIEPEFTMEEVIRISKICPELINKVCTFVLGIKPDFDSLEG